MISSFNFVFVYKPKMQELLRPPKDLHRFASTVVRLRLRKTPIVEHLPNDPSTRAAWIRVCKFPNQNSCLNFSRSHENRAVGLYADYFHVAKATDASSEITPLVSRAALNR
jgi:hypothetical protein